MITILITALMNRIKSLAEESKDEAKETPYKKLLEAVKTIQKAVVSETQEEIDGIEEDIRKSIQVIFPDHDIKFDAKPEEDVEKTINLFGIMRSKKILNVIF